MNPILEALQYPFMQQALAVALLLAVTCALLSCYIVHKGWALMGDAISHAVLPGIVIASAAALRQHGIRYQRPRYDDLLIGEQRLNLNTTN